MELTCYPLPMQRHSSMPQQPVFRFDDGGVLQFKLPYTKQWVYYPVSMCIYGLACFENNDLQGFLMQVGWLEDHVEPLDGGLVWRHQFSLPFYPMEPGWVHGMAQALGVSVMLRMYQQTKKKGYLQTARGLFKSLTIPVECGGVFHVDQWGDGWVEEYGIPCTPRVLNGFMTVMMSVYEYWRSTNDPCGKELFEGLVGTLQRNLFRYGSGFWSRYDLYRQGPCPVNYHRLHVRQLQVLFGLSGVEVFWWFASRWRRSLRSPLFRLDMKMRRCRQHIDEHGVLGSFGQYQLRRRWLSG